MRKLLAIIKIIYADNWFVAVSGDSSSYQEVYSGLASKNRYAAYSPVQKWEATGKCEEVDIQARNQFPIKQTVSSIIYSVTLKND